MANNTLELVIKAQDYASKELKKVEKQLKGIRKTAAKTGKGISDFGKKNAETFKKIGIWAGVATVAIWVMGKQFLDMGTQIEQVQKKAGVVFWEYIWDIKQLAKETANSMWLTQTEFLKAGAGIQDLLIPMWFARGEATKMTGDLLWLSGALSEWSAGQYTASQVWDILAKAMLWEREQLKGLWISISEADVQQRLLENWTKELTGVQLQQAKATATQQLIFEKSTDAQKSFEEWGNSLARQQAILSATMKDAKESIAVALIPAMNELLKVMAPVITDISTSIKLWAENKENIEGVKDTMITTIEVFKTIWKWIWNVIWFLSKMWEMLWTVAAEVVIFSWKVWDAFVFMGTKIWEVWTAVKDTTIAVFTSIKDTVVAIIEEMIAFVTNAINIVKAWFDKIVSFKDKAANAIWNVWANVQTVLWLDGTRATGGPVNAWWRYLVWEKGPEIVTMWGNGFVTPNNKLWGSTNININMWGVVVNNEADENRLIEKIQRSLTNSLQMQKYGIS